MRSRPSSSRAIPIRVGWHRRATRCTAARRNSTSGHPLRTVGWPRTRAASASSAGTHGRPGTSATRLTRRPARRRATRCWPGSRSVRRRDWAAVRLASFAPAPQGAALRSASRWNVSPGLLAAQLEAESGFSQGRLTAGALGMAQFMPATRALLRPARSLRPGRLDDAQAHLMSDLLRRFTPSSARAAARNAGSGAVPPAGACRPTRRPGPTWRASSPSRTAPACCSRRHWRCDWLRDAASPSDRAASYGVTGFGFETETSPTASRSGVYW